MVVVSFLRYGDRSPRGYAARVFAIVWVLVGLVVISITTGVITTSLTAITLSTDVKLYGAKVMKKECFFGKFLFIFVIYLKIIFF